MKYYVYPYKTGSKSAKLLARELNGKVIKKEYSHFHGGPNKAVINWGASEVPQDWHDLTPVKNHVYDVRVAGNKSLFFEVMYGNEETKKLTVPWTYSKNTVRKWLEDGYTVVARHKLTGHSGEGIQILDPKNSENSVGVAIDIPDAPLYTMYIKKQAEYRVHIAFGRVIDIQKKIRDPNREPLSWYVRSHSNGFIYVRNGVTPPSQILEYALKTVEALELDFGAVDLISTKSGRCYVLEVNCAPGLEGTTVKKYVEAIKEKFNGTQA